nr:ferrous iron transport protein B [Loigolactobacillus jiayinensis]
MDMTTTAWSLAGNPNSGKTTLFNVLTGSNQHIGNWPGVTIERKSGKLKHNSQVEIQDLPGIYSLSPYSSEEIITRNYILNGQTDRVLDVVDATNLERNLYLTLQLMETGVPIIIGLNMMDRLKKEGNRRINLKKLAYSLNLSVVSISALKNQNVDQLVAKMQDSDLQPYTYPEYDDRLESAIEIISTTIQALVPAKQLRWYAIKLFERDEEVSAELKLTAAQKREIEATIKTTEAVFDDVSDSIVVNARYDYITRIMNMCVIDTEDFSMSWSDRVDRIVTNRFLALPIFVFVMWVVYYLSIQTIGTIGSDWMNDVLFGKLVPNFTTSILTQWQIQPWLTSLVVDGIISGIGSVLGFLPQIMMLFLCLSILEDCGYMARIAFVMDRIFHRFNLSGKSFIPMLISTGCGVPGIMATRTIENEKDRRMTIMLTTFMPCSAKLTVIALISGTFFPGNSWVAPSAYFLGILAVVGSGVFLKKTRIFSGAPAPFVMELPAYHLPRFGNMVQSVWLRAKSFIIKAGTIIFLSCVVIWFLSSFNFRLQMVDQNHSILRALGALLAPVFAPLGFGDWHATVAVIAGLIAKENCVGTLHITFGAGTSHTSFVSALQSVYSPMAGYAFLVFNLLCAPCFASIGTMYKEFGDTGWTLRAVGYQTLVAYMVAVVIYQGSQVATAHFSPLSLIIALAALALMIYGIFVKREKSDSVLSLNSKIA